MLTAQVADSSSSFQVAPGVLHTRFVRLSGPLVVNVLRVDLRQRQLSLRHVRAHDELRSREPLSGMVRRHEAAGDEVVAAVNADFFDLATGENENNQLVDGEWWKGLKVTASPFGTYENVHTQFGLDSSRRPLLERFQFAGEARSRNVTLPVIALNARVRAGPEGTALFTSRFGPTTPTDTGRAVAEAALASAGHRGDTLLYRRQGVVATTSGGAIPAGGAVLAGYGARAAAVSAMAAGETVTVSLRAIPRPPHASPLALLVGGWPRIIRDGASVAADAPAEEGTISHNAEVRHPRTAVGFTRDSSTLLFVTVDGRSKQSVGVTLVELSGILLDLGVWQALNFDGGGSTTMIVRDSIVNTPSDPAGERAIGNALLLVRSRGDLRRHP